MSKDIFLRVYGPRHRDIILSLCVIKRDTSHLTNPQNSLREQEKYYSSTYT